MDGGYSVGLGDSLTGDSPDGVLVPGLEGEVQGDSSTARTEVSDEDEFRTDVEVDLGETAVNGVEIGDILSNADVDSETLTGTEPELGEAWLLAFESDTALLSDLLLAEDSTDANAEELVFCCDKILFCAGGAAGVDGDICLEANVGEGIGDTLGVYNDPSDEAEDNVN